MKIENRIIIHFDIDAFFASVEQLDYPELRNKPVIVGGNSDRGVVATCSYEARRFGVRSAMSSVVAKRKCPNGIFVKPRMNRYSQISRSIFEYIESIGCDIQQVSVDEGYLDITSLEISPLKFAKQLKEAIFGLTGLTISVGISYNKFLAKLASDWNKPDGIFEITSDQVPEILLPLPIIKIHGLGKKTCEKLNRVGIFTIDDLYAYPQEALSKLMGENYAKEVIDRIHGIDTRPVKIEYERKSYGRETTLDQDTMDRAYLQNILENFFHKLTKKLSDKNLLAKTITIKIKYNDFEQFTRSYSLDKATHHDILLHDAFQSLFKQIELKKPVRLIGLSFSNLEALEYEQFNLLDNIDER